jgi:DNA-binding MarR family transcriptional regulator
MTARLQGFGLARDQIWSALASGAGIRPADLDALEHLEAAGPLTQRQLGDRLSLTSGAITMLVDRLERAGWVQRRQHPGDRRSVLVELSPQAVELAPRGWPLTTRGSSSSRQAFPLRTGKPLPASCKPPPTRPPAFAVGLPGDGRRPQRRPQRDKARDAITYSHQDQVGMPLPDRTIDHPRKFVVNGIGGGRPSRPSRLPGSSRPKALS